MLGTNPAIYRVMMKPLKITSIALAQLCLFPAFSSSVESMIEQQKVAAGKEFYLNRCSGCHGEKADGQGKAAPMLNPKPRNLVEGGFKFRTTPSGNLPTVSDLLRTLNQGIPGSAMPSFSDLPEAEKYALIAFIRSLRPEFKESSTEKAVLVIPDPPKKIFSNKKDFLISAAKGKALFASACVTCHGEHGRGDGPSAEGMVDSYENPIRPADLTKPFLKSGRSAKDAFKAITTGLDGSPMPAFADIFSEEKRWELVSYIFYLRGKAAGIYTDKDEIK